MSVTFVRGATPPDEQYRSLGELARRIYQLRGAGGVQISRAHIAREAAPHGECVAVVKLNANGYREETLGYAFLGQGDAETQRVRLLAALSAIPHNPSSYAERIAS